MLIKYKQSATADNVIVKQDKKTKGLVGFFPNDEVSSDKLIASADSNGFTEASKDYMQKDCESANYNSPQVKDFVSYLEKQYKIKCKLILE